MSVNVAKYPNWDGLTPTRGSRNDDRSPDYEDWDQIVAEVLAIQTEVAAGAFKRVGNSVIGFGLGVDPIADGDFSLAHGTGSVTLERRNFAFGVFNTVGGPDEFGQDGRDAFGFGVFNTVSGPDSFASGLFNTVNGAQSFVHGFFNTTDRTSSVVIGSRFCTVQEFDGTLLSSFNSNILGEKGFIHGNFCNAGYFARVLNGFRSDALFDYSSVHGPLGEATRSACHVETGNRGGGPNGDGKGNTFYADIGEKGKAQNEYDKQYFVTEDATPVIAISIDVLDDQAYLIADTDVIAYQDAGDVSDGPSDLAFFTYDRATSRAGVYKHGVAAAVGVGLPKALTKDAVAGAAGWTATWKLNSGKFELELVGENGKTIHWWVKNDNLKNTRTLDIEG